MWSNDDLEQIEKQTIGGTPLRYHGTPYIWMPEGNYMEITPPSALTHVSTDTATIPDRDPKYLPGRPTNFLEPDTTTMHPTPKAKAVTWRANPMDDTEPAVTGYVNDNGPIILDLPGNWRSIETLDAAGNVVWTLSFWENQMRFDRIIGTINTESAARYTTPDGGTIDIKRPTSGPKAAIVERPTMIFGNDKPQLDPD